MISSCLPMMTFSMLSMSRFAAVAVGESMACRVSGPDAIGSCPGCVCRNGSMCFEPQCGQLISVPWVAFPAMKGLPQYAQVSFVMMDNYIGVGRHSDGYAYKEKTQATNPPPT